MAGLCALKIVLLWAGIFIKAEFTTAPPASTSPTNTTVSLPPTTTSNTTVTPPTEDFLNPSEIYQKAPNELPAKIDPKLPPNCNNLTIDYTCQEDGKLNDSKKLSELEPFTDYSCTGQIKNNNQTTNQTTAIKFRVDCDLKVVVIKKTPTNTSIHLRWRTDSENCRRVLPHLQLSYDCSCYPTHSNQKRITANNNPPGGTCYITGLKPFTFYTCEVQPKYKNKKETNPTKVTLMTETGTPDDISQLDVKVPKNNVIRVTCVSGKHLNGPLTLKEFFARLYYNGVLQKKLENKTCDFEFKDLSYSTEYKLEVTVFNGKLESKPWKETVTTYYNDKALVICLIIFIIITSVLLGVVVYKFYVLRSRRSRNDMNGEVMLEPIYANVPGSDKR